jgi:hypothetical protein
VAEWFKAAVLKISTIRLQSHEHRRKLPETYFCLVRGPQWFRVLTHTVGTKVGTDLYTSFPSIFSPPSLRFCVRCGGSDGRVVFK